MTEIRSLLLTPPADGTWVAVALREASSPDGPWETVQAHKLAGAGSFRLAFRPRVEDGYYKPVWVHEGGSNAGIAEGAVVRLQAARPSSEPVLRRGA